MLKEWVAAAKNIKEEFGLDKALGYLIGEKFYNLLKDLQFAKGMVKRIEEEKKKQGYNPIKTTGKGKFRQTINQDEDYKHYQQKVTALQEALPEFVMLIKSSFEIHEIKGYFSSHPRFGALGHISSEEEHDFLVAHGAVERTAETELDDTLLLGEMMEFFGCPV